MNEICRICLIANKKNEFVNILAKIYEEKTVLQIIIDCASIEILSNDPLPQVVCMKCLENLQSCCELRQRILHSDKDLKLKLLEIKNENLQGKKSAIECKKGTNLENYCNDGNFINRSKENAIDQKKEEKDESPYIDSKDLIVAGNNDSLKIPPICTKKRNEYAKRKGHENMKRSKNPVRKLKRIYECKECNKIFKKADHYTVHMTKHTGEKKYACEFCPKRFARSYVLVYHRRVHTGERPYTCNICSKSFSSPSNFYIHRKIHTGERNYKCDICNESFIRSDSLKIHIRRTHTGERPFLCEICSSAFRSNSSLFTHKLDMHGKKEACPICNNLYSSRVLKQHIRRHKERKQDIKRFVCDQCGKRFTCSSSRKKHLLIHDGDKPFTCEICKKSFNQRSSLKTHMRVHSDLMPFPCDYCSKSFRYKHHLRSHITTHHKEVEEGTSINSCK